MEVKKEVFKKSISNFFLKFIRFLTLFFLILMFCISSVFFYFYKLWEKDKRNIYYEIKSLNGAIRTYNKKYFKVLQISIYDRNNKIISSLKKNEYNFVQLNYFPTFLIDLILLKEDREFFIHKGYNLKRIISSIFINISKGQIIYGGSTITQQISKLIFTDRKKTLKRKIYELFTSYYIESVLSKEEILEIYLNIVYLGFGRFGFQSASLFYFNKNVWELNFSEALMLVSILSSPENYSPIRNIDIAKKKYKILLDLCVKNNFIKKEDSELLFEEFWNKFNINKALRDINIVNYDYAPWVTNLVLKEIDKLFGLDNAYLNNFNIYTTFDLNCLISLNKTINEFFSEDGIFSQKLNKEDFDNIEISLLSMDPETFEIIAIAGGKRYSEINQYNRSIYSIRQTGSAFKPLLYLYGFIKKLLNPISIFEDKQYKFTLNNNIIWEPKNYENFYYGNVPLYFAIKKSINSVAAKFITEIDINDFIIFLKNIFGHIRDDFDNRFKPYASMALGSIEMSLLELISAYSTFANSGIKVNPYFIKRVESTGEIIYEVKKLEKEKVYEKKYADMILYLLKFPLDRGGTAYNSKVLSKFFYQTFGKTGTTNDGKDSWFIGITGKLVTGVWIGYEKGLGSYFLTGGGFAARFYFEYIKNIYQFYLKYYDFLESDLLFRYININKLNIYLEGEEKVLLPFDKENYPYDMIEKALIKDNENIENIIKEEFLDEVKKKNN